MKKCLLFWVVYKTVFVTILCIIFVLSVFVKCIELAGYQICILIIIVLLNYVYNCCYLCGMFIIGCYHYFGSLIK
jgi:hypothetical protein